MDSMTAVTHFIDDLSSAAEELAGQVSHGIALRAHTAGLVFCDSDIDRDALDRALRAHFGFDLVYCTTIGILGAEGIDEFCIRLTVLTDDVCCMKAAMTGKLTEENIQEEVRSAYRRGADALGGQPKLILAFPPSHGSVMLDAYPEALATCAPGIPVFGGVPLRQSYNMEDAPQGPGRHFCESLSILLIGGNLRPVFAMRGVTPNLAEQKRIVTSAKDNVIYRVGDKTCIEYLRALGLAVEDAAREALLFEANPFIIEVPGGDNDGVPLVRSMQSLDLEAGTATTICKVPQGSIIAVGTLDKKDIRSSTEACIRELLQSIEREQTPDYRYRTILCATCMGRYMIMQPDQNLEGKILAKHVPDGFTLSGFYAYGELCPTSVGPDGARNRAHNETVTLCAF